MHSVHAVPRTLCLHILPADLQRHLRDAHVEKVLRQRTCARCTNGANAHDHPTRTLLSALSMPEEAFPCETPVSHPSPSAGGAATNRMPFGRATASPRATASATASPGATASRFSDQGTGNGSPAGTMDDSKLQSDVSAVSATRQRTLGRNAWVCQTCSFLMDCSEWWWNFAG
jgi:hypothetical protein